VTATGFPCAARAIDHRINRVSLEAFREKDWEIEQCQFAPEVQSLEGQEVVVSDRISPRPPVAFIWRPATGMRALRMGPNSQGLAINDLGRSVGLRVVDAGVVGLTRLGGVIEMLPDLAPHGDIAPRRSSAPRRSPSRPTATPFRRSGPNGVRLVVRHGE
jgi:hypothetical protein